jgi:transposase-like protein
LFRIHHEDHIKHKGKRGHEELAREGTPRTHVRGHHVRTSNAEISMAKRSRIDRMDIVGSLIKQGISVKDAAQEVGLGPADMKKHWKNKCHDDESDSASEDDGAYVGSAENAKNLVPSDSDEDAEED